MTGPDHYRSAQGLVVQAEKLMNGDELAGAAVWAAVAQVHATLALAAATARTGADERAWTDAAGPKLPPTQAVSAP